MGIRLQLIRLAIEILIRRRLTSALYVILRVVKLRWSWHRYSLSIGIVYYVCCGCEAKMCSVRAYAAAAIRCWMISSEPSFLLGMLLARRLINTRSSTNISKAHLLFSNENSRQMRVMYTHTWRKCIFIQFEYVRVWLIYQKLWQQVWLIINQ